MNKVSSNANNDPRVIKREPDNSSSNQPIGSKENTHKQVLTSLKPMLQTCKKFTEAYELLQNACGGDRGLKQEQGCFIDGTLTLFLINNPQKSNSLSCLKANQEGSLESMPVLKDQIALNDNELLVIIETPNRDNLIQYTEADNLGLVSQNAKDDFMKQMKQIIEQGVIPENIVENRATNLFYDKNRKKIIFLDLDKAYFDEEIDPDEKHDLIKALEKAI